MIFVQVEEETVVAVPGGLKTNYEPRPHMSFKVDTPASQIDPEPSEARSILRKMFKARMPHVRIVAVTSLASDRRGVKITYSTAAAQPITPAGQVYQAPPKSR